MISACGPRGPLLDEAAHALGDLVGVEFAPARRARTAVWLNRAIGGALTRSGLLAVAASPSEFVTVNVPIFGPGWCRRAMRSARCL